MAKLIMGVQAAQRAKKKPRDKTQMYITPGWDDDPEPIPPVEQRERRLLTDAQRKARRLQRT